MPTEVGLRRLDFCIKNLFNSYEWRSIRQFFMAEASEDHPDMLGLKQMVLDKITELVNVEVAAAKERTGH